MTHVCDDEPVCPRGPLTVYRYNAELNALRTWSGLTYRQLAARAEAMGEVLPASTLATALHRDTLPRPEMVASLVRAAGLDEAAVACWLEARQRTEEAVRAQGPAGGSEAPPAEDDRGLRGSDGTAPGARSAPRRLRRTAAVAVAVLAGTLGVSEAVGLYERSRPSPDRPAAGQTRAGGASSPALPAEGWRRIRPQHVEGRGLCIGEGRERNGRTDRPLAVQRPCGRVAPPTRLHRVGTGVYEIRWHHPRHGVGCLTVDLAHKVPGALLAPAPCTGASHQRFAVEPVARGAADAYRLRPLHSSLCLGALGGEADTDVGAELAQSACGTGADQMFSFTPHRAPEGSGAG